MLSDDARIAAIGKTLNVLFLDSEIVELRVLAPGIALRGFFDDRQAAVHSAIAAEDEGYAVYAGLNPRIARQCFPDNELKSGRGASADDIASRRWLLLDIDPIRPADVCSTQAEKRAAGQLLAAAVRWLRDEQGWPDPVLADSGNGYHALFRIELPAQDEGLVKGCLDALAARFGNQEARIDTSVYDAPRICRLYGTKNCKGEHTDDRPHRVATLLSGQTAVVVPRDKLEALAALAPPMRPRAAASTLPSVAPPQPHSAEAMAFIASLNRKSGAPLTAEQVIELARAWMQEQPPAVSGRDGHNQTFAVACGLVIGYGLAVDEARPIIGEYNAKCQPPWSEKELEHKLVDAFEKAVEEPERLGWLLSQNDSEESDWTSQTDMLMALIHEHAQLWHTVDNVAFASVTIDQHVENHLIRSKSFRHWLGSAFYAAHKGVPNGGSLTEAVQAAQGMALFEGDEHEVFVRVAGHEGKIYVDLADPGWQAVEVDEAGWRVVKTPPVKFRRPGGMLPLPMPASGGKIDELREFLNVAAEDFMLIVAWLLMALNPKGDYPILIFSGEQGSAKSTACRLLRSLVDPDKAPLRRLAKRDDLLLAANNAQVIGFDNLSRVTNDDSDLLCSIATGLGDAKRELYTDLDEVILQVCRPIMMNGITNVATRGDLMDRCVVMALHSLSGESSSDEHYSAREVFEPQFEAARPRILGALLDGVSHALGHKKETPGTGLPRMADFSRWAMAAVAAFGWDPQAFRAAYTKNRLMAKAVAADDHPLVPALQRFLDKRPEWLGGARELLSDLIRLSSNNERIIPGWPKSPQHLSAELLRLLPALRAQGIFIDVGRHAGGGRKRFIRIWRVEEHSLDGDRAAADGPG